jgi:hypothetical protein
MASRLALGAKNVNCGMWYRKSSISSGDRKFQTPPDLVVKLQPIDMVEVILRLVLRPRVMYQREIKGSAALNIGEQLSTTKSDGM